ncbi:extracellular solute-binding protein [Micromonospora palomenae]|uniref:extracellular solute-binding protein n=1 Tax=Micromonospora palomenae TaxID=1461247 RepID=UPI003F8C4028
MTDRKPRGASGTPRRRRRVPASFLLGVAVGTVVGVVATLGWYVATREEPLERGELVILSGKDTSSGGQREELVKLWNVLHPQSPARIREAPVTTDQQHSEMVGIAQAQAAGGGDDPDDAVDIYNLDVTFTAEFAAAGHLRPIDEARLAPGHLDAFVPEVLDSCRYRGSLWALPFNTDAGLLFYRSDLVTGGTPAAPGEAPRFDWDAILDRSAALTGAGGATQRPAAGYVGQFGPYEGLTVNGMELLWAGGVDRLVDETENRVVFQRERWERRLRDVAAARRDGLLVGDAFTVPGDEARSLRDFQEGRALFMRNWPVNYRSLADTDTPGPRVPFEVTRLPGPSALGGQNLAIAKQSRQPRAAQALIEFLTREEAQRTLFTVGGFAPTRTDVYADAALRQRFPYLALLAEAVREARVRPRVPHYFQFSRVFREGVRTALEGDGTLPEDFEARLNRALRGG